MPSTRPSVTVISAAVVGPTAINCTIDKHVIKLTGRSIVWEIWKWQGNLTATTEMSVNWPKVGEMSEKNLGWEKCPLLTKSFGQQQCLVRCTMYVIAIIINIKETSYKNKLILVTKTRKKQINFSNKNQVNHSAIIRQHKLTRVLGCRQPVFNRTFCENLTMEGLKKIIYPGVPCK